MRTILTLTLILVSFCFIVVSLPGCGVQESEEQVIPEQPLPPSTNDCRWGNWGDTKLQIQKKESEVGAKLLMDSANALSYFGTNKTDYYFFTYFFTAGKLDSAEAYLKGAPYDQSTALKYDHLTAFKDEMKVLRNKYGSEKEIREDWASEAIKTHYANSNAEAWNRSIILGNLRMYATWETDRSIIVLSIGRKNIKGDVEFKIAYAQKT